MIWCVGLKVAINECTEDEKRLGLPKVYTNKEIIAQNPRATC